MSTIQCFDPENPDQPCPICGGLGVVKKAVPDHHHPDFGKFFRCVNNPVEEDEAHQEKLLKLSNLASYRQKTFDSFEMDAHKSLEDVCERAWEFANDPSGWILFEGKYGSGKTHLAAAIGHHCLASGQEVLFLTVPDLLDHLRATFSPRSDIDYDDLFERVKTVQILILDDLGVENPSPWAKEKLFQLLNTRYVKELPTVITTNTTIDHLDPRIASRLLDRQLIRHIHIVAPDYRKGYEYKAASQSGGITPNDVQILNTALTIYSDKRFSNFTSDVVNTHAQHQNLEKSIQSVVDFMRDGLRELNESDVSQMPNPNKITPPWLLLMGGYGVGKTHLAAATANHLKSKAGDNSRDVIFITTVDLLDHLKATFNPDSDVRFDKLFEMVKTSYFLILDDLNTSSTSKWAKEKLFQILEYRYVKRYRTLVTTNQPFNEMDERFQTRFGDIDVCRMFYMDLPSYAERKKQLRSRS